MKKSFVWQDYAVYIIIGALLIAIASVWWWMDSWNQITVNIPDRCGPIMNFISHTVPDEESCYVRCKTVCTSKDLSIHKAYFTAVETGCNTCTCVCS